MDTARIADLLCPFLGDSRLPPANLSSISTYIDLLLRWNARTNLTAIRHPEEIVTRHFGESLFAARHVFPSVPAGASRVVDIGSGAGFPGLPIKIWTPCVHLTLIESNQKKATFLREVVRAITLTNVNVICGRAEDFSNLLADTVTLRAVERFETILPVAARLVAPAGRLALLIGEAQLARAHALTPGFTWSTPIPVPLSSTRCLAIGLLGWLHHEPIK
jgi:16S rRNA (guanine527-N7)-methyltransferase